jgi:hypothetical protein
MVDSVTQGPLGALQALRQQADSLWQGYIAHVTLNSDLQKHADIINDTTGKFSDADKIKAYTEVYDAERALSQQPSGEQPDAANQRAAFDSIIKDSIIGKAVIDGQRKLNTFVDADGRNWALGPDQKIFFDGLSNIEKQLPQFKSYQFDMAARVADEVRLSPEAQALLRAGAQQSDDASFLASFKQQNRKLDQQLTQAYQAAEASISLTPQLQQLADIINDRTGKYSDQAKVDAYTQATHSYYKLERSDLESSSWDPFVLQGTAPLGAAVQFRKFTAAVADSTVVSAVTDAGNKLSDFIKAHGGVEGDKESAQFFASLTPLEKLLEGYRDYGTPIAKLLAEDEARLKVLAQESPDQRSREQSAGSLEAEILFGVAGQPVSPSNRSSAGESNVAALPTASSDRLRMTV